MTVFNHQMRYEDINEPRSSASRSSDFRMLASSKVVIPRQRENICLGLKASNHGNMWTMLVQGCIRLLQTLRMKLSVEDPTHIVYTTLRVLDLIIISYSRGHISPPEKVTTKTNSLRSFFRISGTQIYSSSNPCQPHKGAITLARRKLECLDGFLDNKEVWVFHGEQSDPRRKQPLYLSTLPEDFADIWGPMWKMTDSSDATRILRYDLEHGSIIPLERSLEGSGFKANLAMDEELCHWVSDNKLRRKGDLMDVTIISKPRLLIGARKRMKLEENRDCHCDASCITRDFRNSCLLQQVGTNKPQRRVDAEAVNGALGGGITGLQVTYSMVTKIEPGRTFKESLIKRWSHDQQRRNPYVLIKRAAVEMSFCTHNSRRIRLIDLFSTKTILRLVDAINPIKDQECNAAVKEILKSDPVKLIDLYIEKPGWREEIAGLVSSCLETLCDTGIKQEMAQPISLFWMYHHEEYILMLPRSSHRWSGFIQDSLQSCAFVVFEEKCLIMEAGRGCQHASKDGKSKAPKGFDSLFESALVVNDRMSQPAGLKLLKKGKTKDSTCWDVSKLERGSTFKMGDSGGLEVIRPLSRTRLLVKWFPKNPFKAGFHEFLSRIVEKEPELHHMEYDGEVITGDPLPISIFVVA